MCSIIYNCFLYIIQKFSFFCDIYKKKEQEDIISIDEEWENILREEL